MKPPSLLDPAFKYVPAHETDIRKTFARVRKEIARIEAERIDNDTLKVLPILRAGFTATYTKGKK